MIATQAAAAEQERQPARDPGGWRKEGRDLLRGVAGGAIVGMPLLYTMEMWQRGMTMDPRFQLGLLGGTLAIAFLFSLVSGFREDSTPLNAAMEAVTSVGIGLIFSAVVLWVIGEIGAGASAQEIVGKTLLEATPVTVGVVFANAQFSGRSRTGEGEEGEPPPEDPERAQLRADLLDAVASLVGSLVFALNIAPTEEVIRIASRLSPLQQLLLLGSSGILCYVILFASGFEKHRVHVKSLFQNPVAETTMSVAISLVVCFVLLWSLGPREAMASPGMAMASTIVLGLPGIVGGAAGRVIL